MSPVDETVAVPPGPGLRASVAAPAARFLTVGALNTALSYALFRSFLALLGGRASAAALAQAGSYAVGIGISYAANRMWTFASDRAHRRALPRFVAAQFCALWISATLVHVGTVVLGLSPSLSWAGATGVTAVLNFLTQRYVVFPSR